MSSASQMLYVQTCLAAILSVFALSSARVTQLEMPEGLQNHFNGAKLKHNVSEVPGEQIFWECMQRVMWQMAERMGHNVTRETRDYMDRLLQIAVDTSARQIPRYRKEYRMLTDEERTKFHNAVRALKEDKTLKPNVYTAIAQLHAGDVIPKAHFGAGFPGWHRIFLLIVETALRMKDPSVSIPYWASNMDDEMEDPTKSIIWSPKFLGNGDGFVTTGPFAHFKIYSSNSVLSRNIGATGSLMTNKGIHGILSRNNTSQITVPNAPFMYNLELQHNTVHVWVGGTMDDLSTSAEDPIFYMHHAFVDYLWEEFRTKQVLDGIHPEQDYPTDGWGETQHGPNAGLGFGDLRNVDALSNVIANLVKYDPSPVCSRARPSCGSKYLRCATTHRPSICVGMSRDELDKTGQKENENCAESHLTRAVQNSFSINQYCDIRKWAYIPVKIIMQRPPEFSNYKAYPVLNNRPVMGNDVFSTINVNKSVTLATHSKCKASSSVARNIFVESYGLNYYGKYKDFTVLDQRHALSSATTYIGVKSPDTNVTDVIVYAYDYCGRSCRPYCLDLNSNPRKLHPCSGVIRITPDDPKMYGNSYAEAVNTIWRANSPDDLPEVAQNDASMTFYCDYSGAWPWDKRLQSKPKFQSQTKTKRKRLLTRQRSRNNKRNFANPGAHNRQTTGNQPLRSAKNILLVKPTKSVTKIASTKPVTRTVTRKPTNLISNKPLTEAFTTRSATKLAPNIPIFVIPTKPLTKVVPVKSVSKSVPAKNASTAKQKNNAIHFKGPQKFNPTKNVKQQKRRPKVTIIRANRRQQVHRNLPNVRVIDLRSATTRPLWRKDSTGSATQNDLNDVNIDVQSRANMPRFVQLRRSQEMTSPIGAPNTQRFTPRQSDRCTVSPGCVLPVPCSPCRHRARQACQRPSRRSAVCIRGVFVIDQVLRNFIAG